MLKPKVTEGTKLKGRAGLGKKITTIAPTTKKIHTRMQWTKSGDTPTKTPGPAKTPDGPKTPGDSKTPDGPKKKGKKSVTLNNGIELKSATYTTKKGTKVDLDILAPPDKTKNVEKDSLGYLTQNDDGTYELDPKLVKETGLETVFDAMPNKKGMLSMRFDEQGFRTLFLNNADGIHVERTMQVLPKQNGDGKMLNVHNVTTAYGEGVRGKGLGTVQQGAEMQGYKKTAERLGVEQVKMTATADMSVGGYHWGSRGYGVEEMWKHSAATSLNERLQDVLKQPGVKTATPSTLKKMRPEIKSHAQDFMKTGMVQDLQKYVGVFEREAGIPKDSFKNIMKNVHYGAHFTFDTTSTPKNNKHLGVFAKQYERKTGRKFAL